jgi:lipopolysaccharide biosynthesis regulator YciM
MSYTFISIAILVVILAIFLFINFDYNSKYKKTEKDLYYEALDQLLIGKLKEAYSTLLALIKNDTNNVKAYLKLGQVLREIGKPDRALKVHKSLLIRKDLTSYERIELLKNISLDYKNLNRVDDAIQQSLDVLKLDKHNEWALSELVDLYKLIDDWNSSKKYLQTYQKITGDLDSRILGLYVAKQGQIELKKEDFSKARLLFEEAVNMSNDLGICYKLIADSYSSESELMYQKSEEDGGEEFLQDAKDLLSKALSMWIKYAQNKPSQTREVLYLIKDALFALDRYSEIEFILKDLLERDSNNIDALIDLADYYSSQGENQKSVSLLDSIKDISKDSVLAHMVRLKLKLNLSNDISDEIKSDFNELADKMSKTSSLSPSSSKDEDYEWLCSNEFSEK